MAAIENGVVRETASFDAKLALPPVGRNKDLAKDICAMTVDGGSLLYGLGGEDPTRPAKREPFDLEGAAERIDQVAQTCIAEPPTIATYDIQSDERLGKGYLCVIVPASPRAPHMLTIGAENRYWGRGATGNRILTEGEVARLYERRERWEVDRNRWLAETVGSMPFTFDLAAVGVIVIAMRPVMPRHELLRAAAGDQRVDGFLRDQLLRVGRETDPFPDGHSSGLGDALHIGMTEADLWVCSRDQDSAQQYQDRVEIKANSALTYWHSPALGSLRRDNGPPMFLLERAVTSAVYQAIAVCALLYEQAQFHGPVDVGVAVLGIEGAGSSRLAKDRLPSPTYGTADYRRHARVTGEELRSDIEGLLRRLLDPLYEVISGHDYDPLADSRIVRS